MKRGIQKRSSELIEIPLNILKYPNVAVHRRGPASATRAVSGATAIVRMACI